MLTARGAVVANVDDMGLSLNDQRYRLSGTLFVCRPV